MTTSRKNTNCSSNNPIQCLNIDSALAAQKIQALFRGYMRRVSNYYLNYDFTIDFTIEEMKELKEVEEIMIRCPRNLQKLEGIELYESLFFEIIPSHLRVAPPLVARIVTFRILSFL